VHNSIRPKYVETLKNLISGVKVGNPDDPTATMGPLISAAARARTEQYVDLARAEGGQLIAGGERPLI
jgi:acyl-CoA reductase-like NAD-dependent aldehyde dehydrogenase